jgi:hypothetical protein
MSFPGVLRIGRYTPICGIITSRPQRSRTFPNPTERPPTADQQPRPSTLSSGNRPTGHGRPILSPVAEDQSAEGASAPDSIGASRDRGRPNPRRVRTVPKPAGPRRAPAVTAGESESQVGRPPPLRHRTTQQPGAGFEPSPQQLPRPAALTNEAKGHLGWASTCTQAMPSPTGPNHVHHRRRDHSPAPTTCQRDWTGRPFLAVTTQHRPPPDSPLGPAKTAPLNTPAPPPPEDLKTGKGHKACRGRTGSEPTVLL